jgi:hypothetical protein
MATGGGAQTAEQWLRSRLGTTPRNSLGWFRAGVGFYNKVRARMSPFCAPQ